jgi:hypothetical protein
MACGVLRKSSVYMHVAVTSSLREHTENKIFEQGDMAFGREERYDGARSVFLATSYPTARSATLARFGEFWHHFRQGRVQTLSITCLNDASSARPEGSMTILHVFWWKHNCKSGQYSSAKVHNSLCVNADGSYVIDADAVPSLKPKIILGC